ncbi:MAG TPA: GNAT family N-acetyltransferase [Jatrophihabitans sp.]|nr:GNAT family N-acetyltransferase [Jatrophihabitans sp.]
MPELVRPAVPAGRLRAQQQPTLAVDELTVRPWRFSDSPAVVEAYRDPEIQRWHVRSMDEAEARDWVASWSQRWAAETGASWAVTAGDVLLGRTGFRRIDLVDGSAEAAYWTVAAARGRGVAVRALRAVSQWMLDSGGLHRLELNHSVANPASCRVARKAGYHYEGSRRQQALHLDGWHDMHLHAFLHPAGPGPRG